MLLHYLLPSINPTLRPVKKKIGSKIILDMLNSQNKNRKETTSVFWNTTIMKRPPKRKAIIILNFIIIASY
jgi:hypothetical protein